MAAYIITSGVVSDPETYERYRAAVPATLGEFGGRYLVRGGAAESLESDELPPRQVVLEFPDMDSLKAWYSSPAYSALIPLRLQASTIRLVAVEGV